jgi:hypothetical protein
MWLLIWAFVLLLVHVQFMHCRAITMTLLKVLEATLIVFALRLWSDMPEHMELILNATMDQWGAWRQEL